MMKMVVINNATDTSKSEYYKCINKKKCKLKVNHTLVLKKSLIVCIDFASFLLRNCPSINEFSSLN